MKNPIKIVNYIYKWCTKTRLRKILSGTLAFLILSTSIRFALIKPKEVEAVWYNDSWGYRKKLIINEAKVVGSSDFTNFPILVKAKDLDLASKAQSDGDDILFTDVNAVKLDHEIENYDSSTGELVAWVEIPTLYAAIDTPIYMYYGNPGASSQQNAAGTWNSNYIAVWHLNETVTDELETATHYDSTSPAENGTQKDNDDITGVIAKGQDFDGSVDYITVGDDADLDMNDTADFTIMAWANIDTFTGVENTISDKKTGHSVTDNTDQGYALYVDNDTAKVRVDINDSDVTPTPAPDGYRLTSSTSLTTNTWYHLTAVWDQDSATNTEIYINGTDDNATDTCSNCTSITEVGSLENALPFRIGAQSDAGTPGAPIWGSLDEVRITNNALSADWITTDYNTQFDPVGFFSAKSEETRPGPNLYFKFDEGYGTTAQDQSEFNLDGTISGASWQTEDLCLVGKCLKFDGSDDIVTVANSPPIDFNEGLDTQFTIETWVRVNSDGEGSVGEIFDKDGGAGTPVTYMRITNDGTDGLADLEVSIDLAGTPATLTITNGITLNRWHHIALGYTDDSDDEITIYIDGINKGSSVNGSGAPDTDTFSLLIGGSSTANFHGFLDEFKIYDEERTADQIKADLLKISTAYGSSAAFGDTDTYLSDGLVGYWKMDESSGDASDSSGNNLTLTNNNTTTFVAGKFGNGSEHVPASSQYFSPTTTATYYFDASDAVATDPNKAWSNDLNAFDGSTSTNASTLVSGNENTNYLKAEGTNAPASGGNISTVEARMYAESGNPGLNSVYTIVYTDGLSESLGTLQHSGTIGWNSYTTLNTPTGGWTWSKIQSLETKSYTDSGGDPMDLYRIEILVSISPINSANTVSFWTNPDSTTDYYISLTSGAYITSTSGTLSATGFTNPRIYVNGVMSTTIAANTWQLVTVTTDTAINANQFYVGRQGSNYYDGTLDEVRIYNRALSPAEVSQLYNWAPGPIGYWKMDEASWNNNCSTATVQDSSGNDNPGLSCPTTTGPTSLKPGKFGNAGEFDGVNDYIYMNETSLFDFGTSTDFTVGGWVKLDTNAGQRLFRSYEVSPPRYSTYYDVTEKHLKAFIEGGGSTYCTIEGTTDIANGKWHHISFVFHRSATCTASGIDIYVDGVKEVTSLDWDGGAKMNENIDSNGFYFTDGTDPFDGLLDDVKLYNYARTSSQVIEDMNAGHPAPGSPIGSAVAHWKFDEGYGDTAYDSSPQGNDGNLAGTSASCPTGADPSVDACPAWSLSGKFGKALSFNESGVDDYVEIDDDASLRPNGDSYTISFWANPPNTDVTDQLIGKEETTGDLDRYRIFISNNIGGSNGQNLIINLRQDVSNTWYAESVDDIADGNWHHYLIVIDSVNEEFRMYMDGVQLATDNDITGSWPIVDNTQPLRIGANNSGTQGFTASIDEVQFFNNALTQDQIKQLYNQGAAAVWGATSTTSTGTADWSAAREYCPPGNTEGNCAAGQNPSPILHIPFNENTGTSSVYDISGNNQTGTITGSINWLPGKYGSSIKLDGAVGRVQISEASLYDFGTSTPFTLSGWFKLTDNAADMRLLQHLAVDTDKYYFRLLYNDGGGDLNAIIRRDTPSALVCRIDSTTTTNFEDDQWHHIEVVFYRNASCTLNDILIYVDGKLANNNVVTSTGTTNGDIQITGFEISSNSEPTKGQVDEIRVYNYARTPAQIAWEFNRGGPVGWWKFDENSGTTTVYDSSGFGNTGSMDTSFTGTEWTQGKLNSALSFTPSETEAITVTDSDSISLTTAGTVTAWVYSNRTYPSDDTNYKYRTIFNQFDSGSCDSNDGIGLDWYGTDTITKLRGHYCNGTNLDDITYNTTFEPNQWYHLAFSWDGTNQKLYINGVNVKTEPQLYAGSNSSGENLRIGCGYYTTTCSNSDNVWDGKLDDLRMYNYALTDQQIKTVMSEGAIRFGPATGSP